MAHGHHHEHTHHRTPGHSDESLKERKLLLATLLNIVITIAEIVGGLVSNSLALLSDAVHNLGDTFAIFLAFVANRIGNRDATHKRTFGYKRIEILAALFNAVVLIVITIFLFIESYHRFLHPEPIKGIIMFWVALIGLIANLFAVLLLKSHSDENINIRAAYLHLLGDTISSVAVIVGSVLIYYFNVFWIDPLVTLLIGLYILKEAYTILMEAVNILMQSTPSTIDLSAVVTEIEKHPEICNVHHVHAWKLDDKQIHFECHADLNRDLTISETDLIRFETEKVLKKKFNITHVTMQFEFNCCSEKSIIHKSNDH